MGLRQVFGTIRNPNGQGWELINDAYHQPLNIQSVVTHQDDVNDPHKNKITINFNFTATKVGTLIVTPDEVAAKDMIFCGSDVGLNLAHITMTKPVIKDNQFQSEIVKASEYYGYANLWISGWFWVD